MDCLLLLSFNDLNNPDHLYNPNNIPNILNNSNKFNKITLLIAFSYSPLPHLGLVYTSPVSPHWLAPFHDGHNYDDDDDDDDDIIQIPN